MASVSTTAEHVLTSLTRVIEPEFGINVVDLGLVYGIEVNRGTTVVQMTMASSSGDTRETTVSRVQEAIRRRHPDIDDVIVDLVWDPPWRDDFITDAGHLQLRSPIAQGSDDQDITVDGVMDSLMQVMDPEVGINMVDLGLVYDVLVEGRAVHVTMTLTTPGCPLHATIEEAVRRVIETRHPDVADIQLGLVWDPPWDTDMISDAGKEALGWV